MLKTEVRLLNKICQTDFFNVLLADSTSSQDYTALVEAYCSYVWSRSQAPFLNEPRSVQSRWWSSSRKALQPPHFDTIFFTVFNEAERLKINKTVKLSNEVISDQLDRTVQNTSYSVVKALDSTLNGSRYFFDTTGYSFLDVIVFSSLQKCRIWPKVIKEGKKSRQDLPCLVDWYKVFLRDHRDDIEYKFDPSVVRGKYHKQLEQEKNERKNDVVLLDAVRAGDIDKIQSLIKNGSDIESREPKMWKRASHLAAELGNIDVCRCLDSLGCNWNALDKEEQTPLFYAVTSSSLSVVKFLVDEKQVDHQHKEYQARTPFYLACFVGYMPIIEFLIEKGVNVNEPSKLGRCALSKACYLGYLDVVQKLIDQPEINVALQDSKGRTPLHNAAWGAQGGKDGKRKGALILNDSPESIKLLFKRGHPIDLVDFEGNTALMSAASSDARDSLEVLVSLGANPHIINTLGESAVFVAAKFGHLQMLRTLIEGYKVDPQTPDIRGTTPLEIAAIQLKTECLYYLANLPANQIPTPAAAVAFLTKIHDSFYTATEQLEIFTLYSSSIKGGFSACFATTTESSSTGSDAVVVGSIKLDENLLQFLVKECTNTLLTTEIIKKISLHLSYDDQKQLFLALALNGQLERAIKYIVFDAEGRGKVRFTAEETLQILSVAFKQQSTTDSLISYCMFQLPSSWMENSTHDSTAAVSIIHKLCEHRKMAIIVDIVHFVISDPSVDLPIFMNPYMIKTVFTHEKIRQLFLSTVSEISKTTAGALNSLDICVLAKANDIHHVIESFLREFLHEEPVQKYCIPKYSLEITSIDSTATIPTTTATTNSIPSSLSKVSLALYAELNSQADSLNQSLKSKGGNKQPSSEEYYRKIGSINPQLESRPLVWIDSISSAEMNQLIEAISENDIFGIDLEYFSAGTTTTVINQTATSEGSNVSSELGFVCTIQISTPTTDFVIDAMRVRDGLREATNHTLFANPQKVKVMHGCSNDLVWLKRDFDIDVVNLFDTMKANMMIANEQQSSSLKTIALKYIEEDLDKSFQLSDWRIRPLPSAMLLYARIDSFVLIKLYPILREELLKKSLLSHMQLACLRILIKNLEKHTHTVKLALHE